MLSTPKIGTILAAASLALASCKKNEQNVAEPVLVTLPQSPELGESKQDRVLIYSIKKGDTLSEIAKRFKVELDDIKEANDIDNPSLIKAGDKLKIYIRLQDRDIGVEVRPDKESLNKNETKASPKKETNQFGTLARGEVPTLSLDSMPAEAKEHSRKIGNLIRRYALDNKLEKVGKPYCGGGISDAFNSIKDQIPGLGILDAIFADKMFFKEYFGAESRDAWKIRKILDILASREDTGWVKVDIHDFVKSFGPVVRKPLEGQMYRTHNFSDGVLVCYDPNPEKLGKGAGAEAHGHIEWITKDKNGLTWHVHAVNSEVHGGSAFGRKQLHSTVRDRKTEPTCHIYILTTPEIKAKWLARKQL